MHRRWLPPFLLLLPLVWLFRHALFGLQHFAFRDAAHYYFPYYRFVQEAWQEGLPLWNPLDGIGQPLLADPTAAVLYPGKLLFLLPLEYSLVYAIYIVAHLWLAGAGAYYCARYCRAGTFGAMLCGISYELSGHVLFQYCNPIYCVGAAWLPWSLLCIEGILRTRARDDRRPRRYMLLLAIVWSMMILGGDPQIAMHSAMLGLLRVAFVSERTRFAGMASLVVAGTLALLLSAVQVLPTAEWAADSDRASRDSARSVWEWASDSMAAGSAVSAAGLWRQSDDPAGHGNRTGDFSVGPWRWAELFCPDFSGRWFPVHQRWIKGIPAEGRTWAPSMYMGLLTVALAIGGLRFLRGSRNRRWLSWMLIFSALAALGEYGIGWLWNEVRFLWMGESYAPSPVANAVGGLYWLLNIGVPGYATLRYPAKWWTIGSMAISLLAGTSWRCAVMSAREAMTRWLVRRVVVVATVLVLPMLVVACVIMVRAEVPSNPLFGPFDTVAAGSGLITSLFHASLVIGLSVVAWRFERRALLLVLVIELIVAQQHLVQTVPREDSLGSVSELQSSCIYRCEPIVAYAPEWARQSSMDRLRELQKCDTATLMPKHHLAIGTRSLRSSVSMSSAAYEALWSATTDEGELPPQRLLDVLGAEWRIVPSGAIESATSRAFADDVETAVSRIGSANAFPRAWIVRDWRQISPVVNTKNGLELREHMSNVWLDDGSIRDFTDFAVVESSDPLPTPPNVVPSETPLECEITQDELTTVEVEVRALGPCCLVLRDQFCRGWMATVSYPDGTEAAVPVLQVNGVMRGVMLQSGDCKVSFRYAPSSVRIGILISSISWLLLVGVIALRGWKERR